MNRSNWKTLCLGFYLLLVSAALAYFILALWHTSGVNQDGTLTNAWSGNSSLFWTDLKINPDVRMILLVIFASALGSCVHAATSFATYVGNRSLVESWYWWYFLRPFIGIALSLITYFAIRGGLLLLTDYSKTAEINPFGIAAIAGLVGMFSKQATDKLRELFDNLFRTQKGDEERANKLEDTHPVREVMLGVKSIKACELKNGKTESNVTIKELYGILKGVVTRIPVFDQNRAAKYVIHQSMLYKFITKKTMEMTDFPVDISILTLEDFLNFEDMRKIVKDSMAFVPLNGTLRDAKRQMERTKNCQDVFITENGKRKEPVLGWLTNNDISRMSQA